MERAGCECIDVETGGVVAADQQEALRTASRARWTATGLAAVRAGNRAGKRAGSRFARRADRDRVTFTTGAIRVEQTAARDLPRRDRPGAREHPAAASGSGQGGLGSRGHGVTQGTRLIAASGSGPAPGRRASPPPTPGSGSTWECGCSPPSPTGQAGDRAGAEPAPAGGRAGACGAVPRAVRRARGSRRYAESSRQISRLQRRVADIHGCHVHRLTARLARPTARSWSRDWTRPGCCGRRA